MAGQTEDGKMVVLGKNHVRSEIAFSDEMDALSSHRNAIALGQNRRARAEVAGTAITLGGGTAQAGIAVTAGTPSGTALGQFIAVALNQNGSAISPVLALACELESEAHSKSIAVAAGRRSIADGLMSIALGRQGIAVAREGGIIAIAFFDQHPGHWESPHGCDPFWTDGEEFLSDLKVAKVGTNGIRANYQYKLDFDGNFVELGPAAERKTL